MCGIWAVSVMCINYYAVNGVQCLNVNRASKICLHLLVKTYNY